MKKIKNIVVKMWPFSKMQKKMNYLSDENIALEKKLTNCEVLLESIMQEKQLLLEEISENKKNNEDNLKNIFELTVKNEVLNCDMEIINNKCQRLEETIQSLKIQYNIHQLGFMQKSDEFWNNHYMHGGTSGTGSYNRLAEFKASIINEFIVSKKINTTIEIGCGDGNQLSLINYNSYTGVDISEYIIKQNRERFKENINYNFYCSLNEKECYLHQTFDLSISMDVIFHLLEDDVYENYMYDLFSVSNKYVIIYSSNHEEYTPWPEFRHRNFLYLIQNNIAGWELLQFIPNKFPYIIGKEAETSSADFYIFQRKE